MENRIAIITPRNFPTAAVDGKRVIPLTPTMEQVLEIECKLSAHLRPNHPMLFRKWTSYYRQYTGIQIVDGDKKIRGNFLCQVEGNRWKDEWIMVLNGGDCYFSFSYDPDKREIFEFAVNGKA